MIIPGTQGFSPQQITGNIFCCEDQGHINESPGNGGFILKQLINGNEKSGASIDGEHPDGSISF